MSQQILVENDKWVAAVHEAGHAVAAQGMGCRLVYCRIRRIRQEWTGETSWVLGPDSASPVVGLAGVVAESIDQSGTARLRLTTSDIVAAIERHSLVPSAADWEQIGTLNRSDVETCLSLLGHHWKWVENIAHRLFQRQSIDDEIARVWAGHAVPFPIF